MAAAVASPNTVLGYHTLAPGAIDFADVPEAAKRGLGRYEVPVFRLGRLAVSVDEQGRGLGGELWLIPYRIGARAKGRATMSPSERATRFGKRFSRRPKRQWGGGYLIEQERAGTGGELLIAQRYLDNYRKMRV